MAKKIKQGWQCPECLTVYAPSIVQCTCAVPQKPYTTGPQAKITVTGPWVVGESSGTGQALSRMLYDEYKHRI